MRFFTLLMPAGLKVIFEREFLSPGAAKMNNGYISLKDLVLPGELRSVLAALENSPEMTDTLLFSLIQLMNQPDKVVHKYFYFCT